MTSLLESAISIIAPHHCIVCSKESNILCDACFFDVFNEPCEMCVLCSRPTIDSRVCPQCQPKTALRYVWMAGTYDGPRRQLIRAFKFERRQAAHKVLAEAMLHLLPYQDMIVVPIPTASKHVRVRGYDQSMLLATYIARQRGWHCELALRRRHNERQVGATRARRVRQAESAFELTRRADVTGKHILLIDDVTTSGATLSAAARLLAEAGAASVCAAVVAKHTLADR